MSQPITGIYRWRAVTVEDPDGPGVILRQLQEQKHHLELWRSSTLSSEKPAEPQYIEAGYDVW